MYAEILRCTLFHTQRPNDFLDMFKIVQRMQAYSIYIMHMPTTCKTYAGYCRHTLAWRLSMLYLYIVCYLYIIWMLLIRYLYICKGQSYIARVIIFETNSMYAYNVHHIHFKTLKGCVYKFLCVSFYTQYIGSILMLWCDCTII